MAHLQQVVVAEMRRGTGKPHDPIRMIVQHWSTDGQLLVEQDPCAPRYRTVDGEWDMPKDSLFKVAPP